MFYFIIHVDPFRLPVAIGFAGIDKQKKLQMSFKSYFRTH